MIGPHDELDWAPLDGAKIRNYTTWQGKNMNHSDYDGSSSIKYFLTKTIHFGKVFKKFSNFLQKCVKFANLLGGVADETADFFVILCCKNNIAGSMLSLPRQLGL